MQDDDQGLGAVFEAASAGAPPAGFDHADVVRASGRAAARRRSVLLGAAAALVVLAAAGGTGAGLAAHRTGTAGAAGSEQAVEGAAPDAAGSDSAGSDPAGSAGAGSSAVAGDAGPDAAGEAVTGSGGGVDGPVGVGRSTGTAPRPAAGGSGPAPGGTPAAAPRAATPPSGGTGIVVLGPGHGTCANRQDPALRALVDRSLPDVAGARAAATPDLCLPGGQRRVSIEYAGGVLQVSYLPPGTVASLDPGYLDAATASGGTVIVPARYPQLLASLAPRL